MRTSILGIPRRLSAHRRAEHDAPTTPSSVKGPHGLRASSQWIYGFDRKYPSKDRILTMKLILSKYALVVPALLVASLTTVATTAPAWAANGTATSVGGASNTVYTDNGDVVTVCDFSIDGHGAIGWISVQQTNGSYSKFPNVYNGKGGDTCQSRTQNVTREGARVRVTACLVDGANGTPYRCASKVVSGTN